MSQQQQNKPTRGSQENLYFEQYQGHEWGEKLSFTVGVSYMAASSIGICKGFYQGFPRNLKLPRKLLMNNFFNALGKESSRYGQAAAAASLLYYITGSTLNLFFEDNLIDYSKIEKNILCGAITGAMYKSTLGIIPTGVGFILGGTMIGTMTKIVDKLNEKGIVAFEMKF